MGFGTPVVSVVNFRDLPCLLKDTRINGSVKSLAG